MKSSCHRQIPSLPFFSQLTWSAISRTRSISWQLKWTLLQLKTTDCSLGTSRCIASGGTHGKHRLQLSRIVLGVFIVPLPTSKRPIVARVGSRGNVFTKSLPSNGFIRYSIYIYIVTCWGTWPFLNIKYDVLGCTGDHFGLLLWFYYDFTSRHYNLFYNVTRTRLIAFIPYPGWASDLLLWSGSLVCFYLPWSLLWSVFDLPSALVWSLYLLQSAGLEDTFLKGFVSRVS
jgi:hypothetical protein